MPPDLMALGLTAVATWALVRKPFGVMQVLLGCTLTGLLWHLIRA